MKLMRSMLFVPGHREGWAEKAARSGADGIILDLEDAVPADMKVSARDTVAASVDRIARDFPDLGLYVRVNALDTNLTGWDLERVIRPGLDGVLLPKAFSARCINSCDALMSYFESRNGVEIGATGIISPLESAEAYESCAQILAASPRMQTLFAGASPGGDVERSIGYRFTAEGYGTLFLRSRAHLAVRASGRRFSLTGIWQDVRNLDGARAFAERSRDIGFTGMVLIHPSHVPIANEVFAPTAADLAFYRGMIAAFDEAEARGVAAAVYEGMHIDYAHVKRARQMIETYGSLAD